MSEVIIMEAETACSGAKTPILKNRPIVFHFRKDNSGKLVNGYTAKSLGHAWLVSRGGVTVVFDPDKQIFAVASCNRQDVFCKQSGYQIAMGKLEHWKNRDNTKPINPDVIQKVGITFSFDEKNMRRSLRFLHPVPWNGLVFQYCLAIKDKPLTIEDVGYAARLIALAAHGEGL